MLSKVAQCVQLCAIALLGSWTFQILHCTAGDLKACLYFANAGAIGVAQAKHIPAHVMCVVQIPNFMLAMPMLYLSVAGCWTHFNQNWNRAFLLGLDCPPPKRLLTAMHSVQAKAKNTQKPLTRYTNSRESVGFNADSVSPYIYQWALMTACALFVMNVQVATR